MSRFKRKKTGLPPGSIVYVGESRQEPVRMTETVFDPRAIEVRELEELDQMKTGRPDQPGVSWLNIDGLHDEQLMKRLTDQLHLPPLMVEDILNTEQRPKAEDFGDHLLIIVKMIRWNADEENIEYEQVSFVLADGLLISFQQRLGDVFDPVRKRLQNAVGRIRSHGADYLTFTLLDVIIDSYFEVLDRMEFELEDLEDDIYESIEREVIFELQQLKKQIVFLRRSVYPLREVLGRILKSNFPQIDPGHHPYFMDAYDHIVQINDAIDTYREMITGLKDLYMSTVSFEMNKVMQVLTIMATIFIPLTFLAGIYGMNFEHMPELEWRYSYLVFWMIIVAVGIGLFFYFRRKTWL